MRPGVRVEEAQQIKNALAEGKLSVEELAQKFNVPVDVVESFVETKAEPKQAE